MTATVDTKQLYQTAIQLQQQRKLAAAWEAFQELLQADGKHLAGLLGISRLLYQNKKYDTALPYLERLVHLHPLTFEGWYLLGVCYARTKNERALAALRKALHLAQAKTPQQYETFYQLAKVLRNQEDVEGAEKLVDRILKDNAAHPKALTLKGQFLQKREENEAAYEAFKKAVKKMPNNAPANHNFACMARVLKKPAEARTHFEKALQLNPNWDEPLREFALLLSQEGEPLAAEKLLKKALKIAPDHPENYRSIAQWYAANGDRRKAIKYYAKLAKMLPEDVAAQTALGSTFAAVGAYGNAIPALKKALEIEPSAEAATALASAYVANSQLGKAGDYLTQALRLDHEYIPAIYQSVTLRAKLCDWSHREDDCALWEQTALRQMASEDEKISQAGLPLLDMNYYNLSMEQHLQLNQFSAAQAVERAEFIKKQTDFTHEPHGHDRLRVGYISPDFRHHPVGRIIQHVFTAHHREQVEIYAYSLSEARAEDDIRKSIEAGVDHFRELSFASNTDVAKQIYTDEIDVLIDLGGYTAYARPDVLAACPAPVQAHFLGYPNTSGADFYDYIIADEQLVSQEVEQFYSEKICRLPNAFPGAIPQTELAERTRADEGIAEDAFVFAAFNRPEKYDPQMFVTWLDIVNAVPNGVLWIGVSPTVQTNLKKFATDHWLDMSRVHFSDWADYATFLQRLKLSDLFLDTLHYGAGATAVASIAMGTPVLTTTCANFTSRLAATVVAGAQQQQLICADLESFKVKAIELANDPIEMQELRAQLRIQPEQLPLFDMDRFAANLENAYAKMYQEFLEQ
ncbi:MAG: tetratricopeptide repeat protein [Saprospiraceae bacterium]